MVWRITCNHHVISIEKNIYKRRKKNMDIGKGLSGEHPGKDTGLLQNHWFDSRITVCWNPHDRAGSARKGGVIEADAEQGAQISARNQPGPGLKPAASCLDSPARKRISPPHWTAWCSFPCFPKAISPLCWASWMCRIWILIVKNPIFHTVNRFSHHAISGENKEQKTEKPLTFPLMLLFIFRYNVLRGSR